jgi:FtsH-binding integral membrane protein
MGSDFWDNAANQHGNTSGRRDNDRTPPPNNPPNQPPSNPAPRSNSRRPNSENPWDAYENSSGGNSGQGGSSNNSNSRDQNSGGGSNGGNRGNNRNSWDNNSGGKSSGGQSNTTTLPPGELAKTYMSQVFAFMFGALLVTAITAVIVGSSQSLMETFNTGFTRYVVMFSPLIMIFVMMGRFHKMSASGMLSCFIAFAVLMGISMSYIFAVYTSGSIFSTFLITAATFGIMAVLGYTTKVDLTKFGSILMMGVIGLIIAMVVNFFMQSTMMHYIISCIGVLIFTGLTAYDVQKLKRIGAGIEFGGGEAQKLAMMGAITLYLDFILLFQFLLRLLGNRS